jgi:hypothetical protein
LARLIAWSFGGSIACRPHSAGCAKDPPARDRYPLASRCFPSVLVLEITTARRPAEDPCGIRHLILEMNVANLLWERHGCTANSEPAAGCFRRVDFLRAQASSRLVNRRECTEGRIQDTDSVELRLDAIAHRSHFTPSSHAGFARRIAGLPCGTFASSSGAAGKEGARPQVTTRTSPGSHSTSSRYRSGGRTTPCPFSRRIR